MGRIIKLDTDVHNQVPSTAPPPSYSRLSVLKRKTALGLFTSATNQAHLEKRCTHLDRQQKHISHYHLHITTKMCTTHCATFTDTLTSIGFLSSSLVLTAQVLPTSFSSIASMAMPCTRHGKHEQRRKEQHDALVETLRENVWQDSQCHTKTVYEYLEK